MRLEMPPSSPRGSVGSMCADDADVLAVEVEPDGSHLRTAVRHHGGKIGECLLRGDEIEELGRDRASGRDVLGRVGTARPCSLDAVMAEAGTAGNFARVR